MNLEKEIITFIAQRLGLELKEISKDSSLTKDLNTGHLEITDLFLALEEHFHLKISEDELENLDKIDNIINYISEHIDEPSAL